MADQRLKKLRRSELLRLLLDLESENEQLADQNAQLRKRLEDREILTNDAGSLAEASARVSGLLSAAQDTADLYLENVKQRCAQQEATCQELLEKTKKECLAYVRETIAIRETSDSTDTATLERRVRALFDNEESEGGVTS